MTELGVYILGAVALAILAAAGIATGNHLVATCAVISSGAAYLSQIGAFNTVHSPGGRWSVAINATFMLVALGAWAYGVFNLL